MQAYRRFYLGEKAPFTTWTRRRTPRRFVEGLKMRAAEKS